MVAHLPESTEAVYLCEKPNQAGHVAKAIGTSERRDGYYYIPDQNIVVTYAMGHLYELAKPEFYDKSYKDWSLSSLPIVPAKWKTLPIYKTKPHLGIVRELLSTTRKIYIATDFDREGEAIARDIIDHLKLSVPIYRIKLNALDPLSVKLALQAPLNESQTRMMAEAARVRQRADWLVGMNLTRLYSLKGIADDERVVHIGRVFIPTIALVVERDKAIESFRPEPFHSLKAVFTHDQVVFFEARWIPPDGVSDEIGRCLNASVRNQVSETLHRSNPIVDTFETSEFSSSAPLPLDLNTLQQIACAKWNYTAQEVLDNLQSLYERHCCITYPRTESRFLPSSVSNQVASILDVLKGAHAQLEKIVAGVVVKDFGRCRVFDDDKVDPAHHAIIPTLNPPDPAALSQAETRLYHLIVRYFAAQFYPKHVYHRSSVMIGVGNAMFRATGSVTRVLGWKSVLGSALTRIEHSSDRDEDAQNPLPTLRRGDHLLLAHVLPSDHSTSPPDFFTEGTLIAAMKNIGRYVEDETQRKALDQAAGIGTAATRAEIINRSVERGYLSRVKHQKRIMSTPKARKIIEKLPRNLTSPGTTALWEMKLEQVANGSLGGQSFVNQISGWISELCENQDSQA